MDDDVQWNTTYSFRKNIVVNIFHLTLKTAFFFGTTRLLLHVFMTRVYLNRHAAAEMFSFITLMILQITFLMSEFIVLYIWGATTIILVVLIIFHQIVLWVKNIYLTQMFYFTVAIATKYYYLYMTGFVFGMWLVASGIVSGFCLGYMVLRISFIGRMVGLPQDPICNDSAASENQETAPVGDGDNPNVPEAQGGNVWGVNN